MYQLPLPATLEAEFKSPTLLPAKLQIRTPVRWIGRSMSMELSKVAHSPQGLVFTLASLPLSLSHHAVTSRAQEHQGAAKEVATGRLLLQEGSTVSGETVGR